MAHVRSDGILPPKNIAAQGRDDRLDEILFGDGEPRFTAAMSLLPVKIERRGKIREHFPIQATVGPIINPMLGLCREMFHRSFDKQTLSQDTLLYGIAELRNPAGRPSSGHLDIVQPVKQAITIVACPLLVVCREGPCSLAWRNHEYC